jgi:hypothetical protein
MVARRVRGGCRWAVTLVAAVALVVGLVRANARYFWCPMMDAVASHSCCAADRASGGAAGAERADGTERGPEVDDADCCEAKRIGALPASAGAGAPGPDVPPSPLWAIVPPVDASGAALRAGVLAALTYEARTCAPPPSGPPLARNVVLLI